MGNAPARPGGFLSITDEQWQHTFDLNLMAAVRTTRAALAGFPPGPPPRPPTAAWHGANRAHILLPQMFAL